jgi:hypothetical protein
VHPSTAFEPGYGGLGGAHALRQLSLGKSGTHARRDQFPRQIEFFIQSGVSMPTLGIRQHRFFHGIKALPHGRISFNRLRASSIARCGVF